MKCAAAIKWAGVWHITEVQENILGPIGDQRPMTEISASLL